MQPKQFKPRVLLVGALVLTIFWCVYPGIKQFIIEKRTHHYLLRLGRKYAYIVRVYADEPVSISLTKETNGIRQRVPATCQLTDGKFSIMCDIEIEGPNGNIGYALSMLQGAVRISSDGIPEINGTRGILLNKDEIPKED